MLEIGMSLFLQKSASLHHILSEHKPQIFKTVTKSYLNLKDKVHIMDKLKITGQNHD
jgi:hypothetical protein